MAGALLSTRWMFPLICFNSYTKSFTSAVDNVFLALPSCTESRSRHASCDVNDLVAATPISGPALVKMHWHSLVMLLPSALTIPSFWLPFDPASLIAARVSAVSPDCVIAITRSPQSMIGSVYLNSDAISTSTGILANRSITYLPKSPAWYEVPHAMITILLTFGSATPRSIPSADILPENVSLMVSGCSNISFSMKCS